MQRMLVVASLGALAVLLGISPMERAAEPEGANAPTDAERARWTMSDMKTLAIALDAYRIDHGKYPGATTLEAAVSSIEPMYIRKAPARDAWGTAFRYIPAPDQTTYTIVSAGADGSFSEGTWVAEGESADFREDCILKNGEFARKWEYR